MAIQIYQITFPTASVAPQRFITQLTAELTVADGGTIDLNSVTQPFFNDLGVSPVDVPAVSPNGYYNFYVDGIMQQSSSYTVDAATDTITITEGTTFRAGAILVLEAVLVATE